MYYSRTIEKKINSVKTEYAAIAIYGARQVGKSTMVDHIFGEDIPNVTLDDLNERALANDNPKLFLESNLYHIISRSKHDPSLNIHNNNFDHHIFFLNTKLFDY